MLPEGPPMEVVVVRKAPLGGVVVSIDRMWEVKRECLAHGPMQTFAVDRPPRAARSLWMPSCWLLESRRGSARR